MQTFLKAKFLHAYVSRKLYKDRLRIQIHKHKTVGAVWPYIRRCHPMNGVDKDLDTFLEYMQDALDIRDLLCIPVVVLM